MKLPLVAFAAILVTACVPAEQAPTSPAKPPMEIPKDVINFAFDAVTAEMIVDECPRGFRFNKAYEDAVIASFAEKYGPQPEWSDADIESTVSPLDAQNRMIDYVQRRGIVFAKPATWCAAGKTEVTDGTRIGKLLITR